MIIYFYKGLTTNVETGNAPAWVLPKILGLGQVKGKKYGTCVSYEMLLDDGNARVAAFTVSDLLRQN